MEIAKKKQLLLRKVRKKQIEYSLEKNIKYVYDTINFIGKK